MAWGDPTRPWPAPRLGGWGATRTPCSDQHETLRLNPRPTPNPRLLTTQQWYVNYQNEVFGTRLSMIIALNNYGRGVMFRPGEYTRPFVVPSVRHFTGFCVKVQVGGRLCRCEGIGQGESYMGCRGQAGEGRTSSAARRCRCGLATRSRRATLVPMVAPSLDCLDGDALQMWWAWASLAAASQPQAPCPPPHSARREA